MSESKYNIALFFGLTPEGGGVPEDMKAAVTKATKAAVLAAAKDVKSLKTVLARPLPVTQWAASGAQVIALLRKELNDLSIFHLLANAWLKYDGFRAYCKEPEHPPTTRYVVPLFKHTVSSKHRPVIELRLDGTPAGKVNFEVEFSIEFEEVSVVIQNKRFMAVEMGSAQAKGTIKCEGTQILEHKLEKIKLPGEKSFGDGYLIDPLSSAGAPRRSEREVPLRSA